MALTFGPIAWGVDHDDLPGWTPGPWPAQASDTTTTGPDPHAAPDTVLASGPLGLKRAGNALRDVLNEHHKIQPGRGDPVCLHDRQRYPCVTVRAILSALTHKPPSWRDDQHTTHYHEQDVTRRTT